MGPRYWVRYRDGRTWTPWEEIDHHFHWRLKIAASKDVELTTTVGTTP